MIGIQEDYSTSHVYIKYSTTINSIQSILSHGKSEHYTRLPLFAESIMKLFVKITNLPRSSGER